MKTFKTQIWEYVPTWEKRDIYVEAETKEDVISYVKSGNLYQNIVEWGDCHETVYDESQETKYEELFGFEDEIKEL